MAKRTTLTATFSLIPALLLAAFTGAGFFGVTSIMEQIPGTEYGCTVIRFEKVENSSTEFLIHTDGCSNSKKASNVFRANSDQLAAAFTEAKFYEGIATGKTFTFQVQGMTVDALNMNPRVTNISEDFTGY